MNYKFKTNINCGGCVSTITPTLDGNSSVSSWRVDTADKNKVLSIESESLSENEIMDIVKQAGFNAEPIKKRWWQRG